MATSKIYRAVAILSGPEPQRSILEKLLIKQFSKLPGRCLLIRGKPKLPNTSEIKGSNLEIMPFLSGETLNRVIQSAEIVVCRAGYSSIMDLVKIRQKALLIPTPGQTEQEYLARHLEGQAGFVFQDQDHLDIRLAFARLQQLPEPQALFPDDTGLLDNALTDFLSQVIA